MIQEQQAGAPWGLENGNIEQPPPGGLLSGTLASMEAVKEESVVVPDNKWQAGAGGSSQAEAGS